MSRSRAKPLFFFFSPSFPFFFFFCDEENKRRERLCKKHVFSSSEFLRTFYEVYGCIRAVFSTSLARAVPSQRACVEGTGRGERVMLSCKVGFMFRVSNSQLSFSCENAFSRTTFFVNKIFFSIFYYQLFFYFTRARRVVFQSFNPLQRG